MKDEFFEENEQADSILTMTLPAQNHINLTVCKEEPEEVDDVQSVANETVIKNESGDVRSVEGEKSAEVVEEIVKEIVQVSSKTPYDEREDDSKVCRVNKVGLVRQFCYRKMCFGSKKEIIKLLKNNTVLKLKLVKLITQQK